MPTPGEDVLLKVILKHGTIKYGSGMLRTVPGREAAHVVVNIKRSPLPIGSLKGTVYAVPRSNPAWRARLSQGKFRINTVDDMLAIENILPKRINMNTTKLGITVKYRAVPVTLSTGLSLVVKVSNRMTSTSHGQTSLHVAQGRGEVHIQVIIVNAEMLSEGQTISILAMVVPRSSPTYANNIAVDRRTMVVDNPHPTVSSRTSPLPSMTISNPYDQIQEIRAWQRSFAVTVILRDFNNFEEWQALRRLPPSTETAVDTSQVQSALTNVGSVSAAASRNIDPGIQPLKFNIFAKLIHITTNRAHGHGSYTIESNIEELMTTGHELIHLNISTKNLPLPSGRYKIALHATEGTATVWADRIAQSTSALFVEVPNASISNINFFPQIITPTSTFLDLDFSTNVECNDPLEHLVVVAQLEGETPRIKYGRSIITVAHGRQHIRERIIFRNSQRLTQGRAFLRLFVAPATTPLLSMSCVSFSQPMTIHGTNVNINGAFLFHDNLVSVHGSNRSHTKVQFIKVRLHYTLDLANCFGMCAMLVKIQIENATVGTSRTLLNTTSGVLDTQTDVGYTSISDERVSIVAKVLPFIAAPESLALTERHRFFGSAIPLYFKDQHFIRITPAQTSLVTNDIGLVIYVNFNVSTLAALSSHILPGQAEIILRANQIVSGNQKTVSHITLHPPTLSGDLSIRMETRRLVTGVLNVTAMLRVPSLSVAFNGSLPLKRELSISNSTVIPVRRTLRHRGSIRILGTVPHVFPSNQRFASVIVEANTSGRCSSPHTCVMKVKLSQNGRGIYMKQQIMHHSMLASTWNVSLLFTSPLNLGEVQITTKVMRQDRATGVLGTLVAMGSATTYVRDQPNSCLQQENTDHRRKNMLLIIIDDLGVNVGAYGDKTAITPNIDSLARRGTLFTHQIVDWPACIPARAAMLTGVRCTNTKQMFGEHVFRQYPGIQTAPEIFLRSGYSTYGLGKVFHYKSEDAGFTQIYTSDRRTKYQSSSANAMENSERPLSEFVDQQDLEYADGLVANEAIAIIEDHKRTGLPFWLAVGFNKPHVPFVAPMYYRDLYNNAAFDPTPDNLPLNVPSDGPAHNNWGDISGFTPFNQMDTRTGVMPNTSKFNIQVGYKSATSFVDDLMGRVLSSLGCLEAVTNIVLWGDQGWHLGNQGLWGKNTLFDASLRAPLIIVTPIHQQGFVQRTVVESIDILPTMLELSNISAGSAPLNGVSLVPMLGGQRSNALSEKSAFSIMQRRQHVGYTIRTSQFRWTEWINVNSVGGSGNRFNWSIVPDANLETLERAGAVVSHRELYDYLNAVQETVNVANDPKYASTILLLSNQLRKGVL